MVVFLGEVSVADLELREDALSHFSDLPLIVKKGHLRSMNLKLPWHSLGSEAAVIEIDGLFALAGPRGRELPDFSADPVKLEEALQQEKQEKLALHELMSKRNSGNSAVTMYADSFPCHS